MNHCFRNIIFLLLLCCSFSLENDLSYLKAFDDSIIYRLAWEKEHESLLKEVESLPTVTMVTARKEKYVCSIPKMLETKEEEIPIYEGPNPLQLLSPLFTQMSCSYRLESFWTYELCHGRYIRQYHEERDGKKVKLQEYYLGKFDKEKMDRQSAEIDAEIKIGERQEVPVRKIEGLSLPYLLVTMDSGTLCDLNGKPRMTRVYYVCYPAGKHEIFSLEEASSCEYEIVVLTPHLCQHPDYRAKESEENKINCWAVEGSPKKPSSLLDMEAESLMLQQQQNLLDSLGLSDSKFKVEFRQVDDVTGQGQKQTVAFITPSGGGTSGRKELNSDQQSSGIAKPETETSPRLQPPPTLPPQPVFDSKLVDDFLAGEYCLNGGTGWWKYEFCYGKRADQYHEEKDGSRTSIQLGVFNKEKHLAWLEENPSKRPKAIVGRKQVSHMYSDGGYCEMTNSRRRVEVKLKCKEITQTEHQQQSFTHSMNAVSLYLLEPQPCEYVLGVEAPFLCPLIDAADANGLIQLSDVKMANTVKTTLPEEQ
ncbi:hypothetical protein DAPPUDRAFT_308922 [Daphnia pulex]|uniref:Endoplasmic reticulum lectin 1 n=1 Tax=Daphnia pulex TaxID=6669 RepID=E9HAB7_DAPPU|nr:hypothetical protein DAPPUDRAFT_308922 [Daphnia pulex]|eukprot:EFX71320.1 hypothetical protein DAPPUDRAFT_308922 [Daphnia pulex]